MVVTRSGGVVCAKGARQKRLGWRRSLCTTRGAAEAVPRGGTMSLGAGNSGGGAKPRREAAAPYFSGQRKKKEIPGVVLQFPKFQGPN